MSLRKTVNGSERKFWTPLRIASTMLLLALLVPLGLSSCNSNDPPANTSEVAPSKPSAAGVTLPPSVLQAELKSANGNPIKLSDYSGKVLVVNLWATWCGPCRSEIPELVKLHQEFQSQGLEIVGLSTENPDSSVQAVREFVKAFNMGYPVGWASQDVASTLMRGNGNIPQSFLIARDGRIVKRFIGFSHDSTPLQLRKAIEDALKG
jgi:thiol-disulfide isomerase/thioredoxin